MLPTMFGGQLPRPRQFLTLVALSGGVYMGLSGCTATSPSAACGADTNDFFFVGKGVSEPVPQPTNASISGGAANFDWDHDVSGLCVDAPDSSNSSTFLVELNQAPNLSDVSFEGRVFAAALIQPYTAPLVFNQGGDGLLAAFMGEVDNIGLLQGNPDGGSATIVVELHMTFNSSGNLSSDLTRALSLIAGFRITTHYVQSKGPASAHRKIG